MTLLEAARRSLAGCKNVDCAVCVELRAAIAAEEAKNEDGTHSCGYFCQRPACVLAQRDELRAKLAAMESAEPVAMVTACCGRRECGGECGNDWQGMRPAYTPMTDEEFEEALDSAKVDALPEGWQRTERDMCRAIERAVLAKLGVGS